MMLILQPIFGFHFKPSIFLYKLWLIISATSPSGNATTMTVFKPKRSIIARENYLVLFIGAISQGYRNLFIYF